AGSYQPTKLDDEFLNMSRATDDADKTIKKVLAATDEVLQPNPKLAFHPDGFYPPKVSFR
ncbi:hypothetical protein SARC_13678, partial [Sphaeroforma arctica JP610]